MKYLKLPVLILFVFLAFTSCNKGKAYLLKLTAEEVTKKCPMEIDHMTTLQSCEYVPEKTLKYNYVTDIELASSSKEDFCKSLERNLIPQISIIMSKKESLPLKSLDPVFLHSYATKSGELICEITITPEMYNKPVDIELLSDEDMYVELQQSARILTPPSPLIIEEGVLLVDVNAIAPRTLEVTCRMEEVEVGEIDTLVFKEALIPSLAEEIRIDQTDKAFKDNNVIFRYVYRDKDDNYVCAVDITPDDYK